MDIHENTNLKPPSTFEQQIEILKSRGLIVDNDQFAISILKRINYYRFSAYCLSFKKSDKFFNGVRFEHILAVYDFDKRLRYLLLNLIESIEIAFRTHISYLIAHKYGCLGHLNQSNFQNIDYHKKFLEELEKEFNRSKEIFVTHHKEKYGGVMPVWVALEIIPFGVLSKLYSNMKKEDRDCISKEYYSLPSIFIESWLACLTDIRNHCAHYSRLYNKNLTRIPKILEEDKMFNFRSESLFSGIFTIKKLILSKSRWDFFVDELETLLDQYKIVNPEKIGFPHNWKITLKS